VGGRSGPVVIDITSTADERVRLAVSSTGTHRCCWSPAGRRPGPSSTATTGCCPPTRARSTGPRPSLRAQWVHQSRSSPLPVAAIM